ncbi:hypothetical protein QR680_013804 [Steinernema hermaphroditum]|uniref:Uncharacterized protein n=1 Tax=Steinernema hermaphroditum TaxID=289476 RepID=A0AA39I8U0_9BILA|nr:hypothetical protein QR680_013804 [Steinernema hermaphroditum]
MLLASIPAEQTSALFSFRSTTSSERVTVTDATLIFSELTWFTASTKSVASEGPSISSASKVANARSSVVSKTVVTIPSIRRLVPKTISVPSGDQMDQEKKREDKNLPHCLLMEWLLCGTGRFYI